MAKIEVFKCDYCKEIFFGKEDYLNHLKLKSKNIRGYKILKNFVENKINSFKLIETEDDFIRLIYSFNEYYISEIKRNFKYLKKINIINDYYNDLISNIDGKSNVFTIVNYKKEINNNDDIYFRLTLELKEAWYFIKDLFNQYNCYYMPLINGLATMIFCEDYYKKYNKDDLFLNFDDKKFKQYKSNKEYNFGFRSERVIDLSITFDKSMMPNFHYFLLKEIIE